jgi:hypothetical protein
MDVRSAPKAPFHLSTLKRHFVGSVGEWRTAALAPVRATHTKLHVVLNAAGETLYGDYRGLGSRMLAVAHLITASQALQGVAQAAGEFVSGTDANSARASCITAASAQLVVMAGVFAVLQATRPHRVLRNFYSELLPTAVQAGLCVLVVLLAARRSTSDTSNSAQVATAVDVTSMMQPVLSIALAIVDALV